MLTQQQVANALLLAPVGTPAAGSVMSMAFYSTVYSSWGWNMTALNGTQIGKDPNINVIQSDVTVIQQ